VKKDYVAWRDGRNLAVACAFSALLIEFEANPPSLGMQGLVGSGLYDDGFVGSGGDGWTAYIRQALIASLLRISRWNC
jgi:hypothetical protein